MRKFKFNLYLFLVTLGIIAVSTAQLQAQSELPIRGRVTGVGARALGMGGAFTSVADDYSATYWNPAGLTLIRRMEFLSSFQNLQFQDKAAFSNYKYTSDESFTKMDAIGFAFPVPTYRGSLVFAFGYNRVQHFDEIFAFSWFNPTYDPDLLDYNDEMTENWESLEKGHLGQYTIAGAVDMSPNLSLGASFNLWRGKNDYQFTYEAKDDSNLWTLDFLGWDDVINSKLSATNFKLGAIYRLGRLMRFSGTIDLPYTLKIDENSISHNKEIWENEEFPGQKDIFEEKFDYKFEYKIQTPFKFGIGGSIYLPQLTLSGDIQYTDWSQMEYKTDPPFLKVNPVVIDSQEVYLDSTMAEINRDLRKMYRATTRIHVGAEFTVPFLYTQLRAGAFYIPSPFKDATTSNDQKYFTLGLGFLLDKQMKFDIAWIHGWWEKTTPVFTPDIRPLTEKFRTNQFQVTLAVRF